MDDEIPHMGLLTKPLATVEAQDSDVIRLAEVEAAFTAARLAFNDAYQRLHDYDRTHRPFVSRVGDRVNIQFLRETAEAKALVVDASKKREKLHSLMAERAALRFKLGLSK